MFTDTQKANVKAYMISQMDMQIKNALRRAKLFNELCMFVEERDGKKFNRSIIDQLAVEFPEYSKDWEADKTSGLTHHRGDIQYLDSSETIVFRFSYRRDGSPNKEYDEFKVCHYQDKTFRLQQFINWNSYYGRQDTKYAAKLTEQKKNIDLFLDNYCYALDAAFTAQKEFKELAEGHFGVIPLPMQRLENEMNDMRTAVLNVLSLFQK